MIGSALHANETPINMTEKIGEKRFFHDVTHQLHIPSMTLIATFSNLVLPSMETKARCPPRIRYMRELEGESTLEPRDANVSG
ncbi:MAG: hypothetical protein MZU97_10605 [Bacillus subtilis]|nr:hypothetical protein [Bacillus subtilis]